MTPRFRTAALLAMACAAAFLLAGCAPPRPDHPVIGAKNFTEQVVLGELLAQEIEAKSHLKVERRFYLAGSYICHQALIAGRIDAYVEYTGTALTAVLKQPVDRDPKRVLDTVRRLYWERYNVAVAQPLGFENTFAMVIRGDDARALHLTSLSQAARYTPNWRLGAGYEFEQRPDGLAGLSAAYGLRFRSAPRTMDLVRAQALRQWPRIQDALDALAGNITAEEMRRMNEAIDGEHRDPAQVVREFRLSKGL